MTQSANISPISNFPHIITEKNFTSANVADYVTVILTVEGSNNTIAAVARKVDDDTIELLRTVEEYGTIEVGHPYVVRNEIARKLFGYSFIVMFSESNGRLGKCINTEEYNTLASL